MFIEQFRLETNPFSDEHVRPYFESRSVRHARKKICELATRQLQCLFLSGAPGVGKSTLVDEALSSVTQLSAVRIEPSIDSAAGMLTHLMRTIGPGVVEGSTAELRNILEVYLAHQAGNGRQALVIVDAMDRQNAEVLRECESLWRLRLKNRPTVRFLFLSRNEDLINGMLPRHEGSSLAQARHVRLSGFGLQETSSYVRGVLSGAGCIWPEELFRDEVLLDVQSFTQGLVGDVDALCAAALDIVAERTSDVGQPRVTRAIVKEVGQALHLRYDDRPWRSVPDERLNRDSVRQSEKSKLDIEAATLLVTSGGETVAEVSLHRPRMVLGRDDGCDISLNSRFVSRYQNLFMETREGWLLIDLNSTNGCFVNGRKVREHYLRDGDMISIGQHELRFSGASAELKDDEIQEPTTIRPVLLNTAS